MIVPTQAHEALSRWRRTPGTALATAMLSSGTAKSATTAKRRERFTTLSATSLRVAKPRSGGGQSGWVAGLQSNT